MRLLAHNNNIIHDFYSSRSYEEFKKIMQMYGYDEDDIYDIIDILFFSF